MSSNNNTSSPRVLTRQQNDMRKSFLHSKSLKETLKWFKKMESCFQESDLGMECWTLAYRFNSQGGSLEKVLSFGKRALKIFLTNYDNNIYCFGNPSSILLRDNGLGGRCSHDHSSSFFIACVCNLLGIASLELNRFDESLSYFNWADRNLTKLEHDEYEITRCTANCVLHTLHATQLKLIHVKVAMGRKQEILVHSQKIFEINEKTMEEGSIELARAYKDVSDAYFVFNEFEESLPYALKALEIYTKNGVGDDSVELAQVRRNLGTIHSLSGEYDKALELHILSLNGLKRLEYNTEWVAAQMGLANTLIALGRNEEGLEAFKSFLPLTEAEGHQGLRVCSFTCMARGSVNLGKFSDARKYMKIANRLIEKKRIHPCVAATAFLDMSREYEKMKEYEPAISNLRRALAIPELPPKNLIDSASTLFSLISLTGNDKKGISYLEEVVERLKDKLGPQHREVGCCYINLGVSYRRLGNLETAAECFVRAKDVFNVSLGPYHFDVFRTCHSLSIIYAEMKRFDLAIKNQEKVVNILKVLGPDEQKNLDGAVGLLKKMKDVATCDCEDCEDCEDFLALISKHGISETGKAVFSISVTEGDEEARVGSLLSIARSFCDEKTFSDAKKYMKSVKRILDKKDINPLVRATALVDMSMVYEEMEDYEAAILYIQRALNIPELPQKHIIESCSRLFSLISVTGKGINGIPYLEEAMERLKKQFGPDHYQVGWGYANLGMAYKSAGQAESAVKLMENAKNILDVSLGPHHLDSLSTSQMLSITYANMGSYDLAIEIQEKVVKGIKCSGPSELEEFLEEAVIYLDKLKRGETIEDLLKFYQNVPFQMKERRSSDFGHSVDLPNSDI